MGEYIKIKGESYKIGTCTNLYYSTLDVFKKMVKDGYVSQSDAQCYLNPEHGFRFRFPFPDEDHEKEFCDYMNAGFDRGVVFKIPQDLYGDLDHCEIFLRTVEEMPAIGISIPCPAELAYHKEKSAFIKLSDFNDVFTYGHTVIEVVQQKLLANGRVATIIRCPFCKRRFELEIHEERKLVDFVRRFSGSFDELQHGIVDEIERRINEFEKTDNE